MTSMASKRLHNCRCRRLADAFRAAFDMETGVARDRDNEPGEDRALDHARIQIPGVRGLQGAHDVTGGVEIERETANGPAAENADVISHDRERRQHHEHGEETGHDQIVDRIDRHHFERLDFFGNFHRSQLRRHGRPAAADHDHRDQNRPHLAQERDHHQIGHVNFRAELLQRMRGLHRERHAHAERRQRHHRRRAHPDEHHLPENRGDIPKIVR